MDESGKLVWKYKPDPNLNPPNTMVVGDLNNDGSLEFYAGTYDGLHILDKHGKLVKIVGAPDIIHEVGICAYNNKPTIFGNTSFQGKYKFRFWDFNGKLFKTVNNNKELVHPKIIKWYGKDHVLALGDQFYILDLNGDMVLKRKYKVPIYDLNGTAVYFQENKKPYFAVVAKYSSRYYRSLLYIFSPEGKLIYQEILYATTALTAIKDQENNREYLLVGGGCSPDGRIIIKKYEIK